MFLPMLCPNACIPSVTSVVEPHHFDADPDSTYHPDADRDVHVDSDFI